MAPALTGRTLAHYAILDKLGEGGMGVVYRARDTRLKRDVAIKVLGSGPSADTAVAGRFVREAEAVAALNHPNIVTLYAVEEADGIVLLAMELIDGRRLDALLPPGGFSIPELLRIAVPLADALWAAHQRGIVHRDIKPSNLMLTTDGRLKVFDFGLARAPEWAAEEPGSPGLTTPGLILGTVAYMSPEQLSGEAADHRSDIFAVGIVLYEFLSGRHPFRSSIPTQVIASILRDDPAPVEGHRPDAPPELGAIVRRCLAKDPAHRYQSARDLRNDLDDLQRELEWQRWTASHPDHAPVATPSGRLLDPPTAVEFILNAHRVERVREWTHPRYRLDREFVELTLLIDQGEETVSGRWSPQARRFQDLGELLAAVDDPAIVVLGAPGCGKSTLLRRLELDVSRRGLSDETAPLTFFIQLNQFRGESADGPTPDPMRWLSERWSARFTSLPPLADLVRDGRMIFLIDALNEMPVRSVAALHEAVLQWRDFLDRLTGDHPGNRVVFSCRTLDYSASLSTPRLRVPQVVIEPLADAQVEQFLLKHSPGPGADIWSEVRGTPQLELMRSPYFLSLLTNQVDASGEIPHGRAALFTGFVRQALRREVERGNPLFAPNGLLTERDIRRITQWTWKSAWELPERGLLMPKLARLAFAMQERGGGGAQVRVGYDEALELLDHDRDEAIVKAGLALSILDEDPGTEEVLYVHQLVQEYFAGRELAQRPDASRLRTNWRTCEMRAPLSDIIRTLPPGESLPSLEPTGWEETALLGAAMTDDPDGYLRCLMETNLVVAGRCAGQSEMIGRISPPVRADLCRALVDRSCDADGDLRVRLAAGLALGVLGDPRFAEAGGPDGRYLVPPTVSIGAGTWPIGEDDVFEYLGERIEAHRPRHDMTLGAFEIGRFPVTNAEWTRFRDAGGYEDARWWTTTDARRWQSGEGTADGTHANVRHWLGLFKSDAGRLESAWTNGQMPEESYLRWKRRLAMSPDEFERHLAELYPGGRLTEPAFWNDAKFNNPLQPVVGVSWYEARAYCSWLSAQSGRSWRLPTEVEWEAAARGQAGRRYAWGDDFGSLNANVAAAKVQRTSPVGIFVEGNTPEGVSDLTGNVEEWTASMFGAGMDAQTAPCGYPYRPDDGREDAEAAFEIRRVLRGGGWNSDPVNARTAYRLEYHAGHRYFVNGFRVAVGAEGT